MRCAKLASLRRSFICFCYLFDLVIYDRCPKYRFNNTHFGFPVSLSSTFVIFPPWTSEKKMNLLLYAIEWGYRWLSLSDCMSICRFLPSNPMLSMVSIRGSHQYNRRSVKSMVKSDGHRIFEQAFVSPHISTNTFLWVPSIQATIIWPVALSDAHIDQYIKPWAASNVIDLKWYQIMSISLRIPGMLLFLVQSLILISFFAYWGNVRFDIWDAAFLQ